MSIETDYLVSGAGGARPEIVMFEGNRIKSAALALALAAGLAGAGTTWADPVTDGFAAYHRADYEAAYRHLRPLADQGVAAAQHGIGVLYSEGKGVEQDPVRAVEWFRKAAVQGYMLAQRSLGNMYYSGQGVERDSIQAFDWYLLAARQGDAPSLYNVGQLLFVPGVPLDQQPDVLAVWQDAARRGHPIARRELQSRNQSW